MPKILLNDTELYYESYGQGEPLVLIGGFSADHLVWVTVSEKLAEKYRVIVFDNRGSGQSSITNGPYSIAQFAKDVVDLCHALDISKAHFIGNSMGGFILQVLAHEYPHLVKSAIISNSSYKTDTVFKYYIQAQLEMMKANTPRHALYKASCAWCFSQKFLSQPETLETLIEMALNNPFPFTIEGYEGQYSAIKDFNSLSLLSAITVPTLVIGSNEDIIFPERIFKVLAEKINQAKYFCFDQCGHLPHIEEPEKYIKIVTEFIDGI